MPLFFFILIITFDLQSYPTPEDKPPEDCSVWTDVHVPLLKHVSVTSNLRNIWTGYHKIQLLLFRFCSELLLLRRMHCFVQL